MKNHLSPAWRGVDKTNTGTQDMGTCPAHNSSAAEVESPAIAKRDVTLVMSWKKNKTKQEPWGQGRKEES